MPIRIQCSACGTTLNVADELRGKKVRCKGCGKPIPVGTPGSAPARAERTQTAPRQSQPPSAEEVRVRRQPERVADDGPPRRKKAGVGVLVAVGAVGGAALVLLLTCLGGIGYALFLWNKDEVPPPPQAALDRPLAPPVDGPPVGAPADPPAGNPGGNVPPAGNLGGNVPPGGNFGGNVPAGGNAPPGGGQPGQLDPKVLKKVQEATVLLRVNRRDGVAEGSGFLAAEPGIVLTNAHVVGMLEPGTEPPQQIDVILNGGEAAERRLPGRVTGVDRSSDLAVVRIDPAGLPALLEIKPAKDLALTQPVYVFGYPFGSRLGKNVTVSQATVSALRRNSFGNLNQVQLMGDMQPGNSGGPVVDARGQVVGVSVAGIRGTRINFAVPGEYVDVILGGRVAGLGLGQTYRQGDKVMVPTELTLINPLGRIKESAVEVWTGDPGQPVKPGETAPPARPGDSPRQRLPLALGGNIARGDIPLPELPPGKTYWVQPVVVLRDGRTKWVTGQPYRASLPVERKPVMLSFRNNPGARELVLKSKSTFKLSGGDEDHSFVVSMDCSLLERTGQPNPQGAARVDTRFLPRFGMGVSIDNKAPPRSQTTNQLIKPLVENTAIVMVVDGQGNPQLNKADLSRVHPRLREDVGDLLEQVQESLQAVAVPLPNRQVQPLEQWRGRRSLSLHTTGRPE
ncbi:MAG TPA: trypsin-like peptidase domain-containing protein, partial [Gemmataceae bacterium]|nr:trypsin-like peptidase domain-containing protein [Gemmataceae bacterium]